MNQQYLLSLKEPVTINNENTTINRVIFEVFINNHRYCHVIAVIEKIASSYHIYENKTVIKPISIMITQVFNDETMEFHAFINSYMMDNYFYRCKSVMIVKNKDSNENVNSACCVIL